MESSFTPERQEVELREAEIIFWFDGTVLEIFAGYTRDGGQNLGAATRIHIKQLKVETKGPDRKERYHVTFVGPGQQRYPWKFEEAEWNALQPLLEALRAVGVEFSSD